MELKFIQCSVLCECICACRELPEGGLDLVQLHLLVLQLLLELLLAETELLHRVSQVLRCG